MILLVCGRARLLTRLRVTFFVPKVEKTREALEKKVASKEVKEVREPKEVREQIDDTSCLRPLATAYSPQGDFLCT